MGEEKRIPMTKKLSVLLIITLLSVIGFGVVRYVTRRENDRTAKAVRVGSDYKANAPKVNRSAVLSHAKMPSVSFSEHGETQTVSEETQVGEAESISHLHRREGDASPEESQRELQEEGNSAPPTSGEESEGDSGRFVTIMAGNHKLRLERGKKYLIIGSRWNPNPHPYTPEESQRHAELCRKLMDPNIPGREKVRILKEIEALGPGLALGAEWRVYYWFPLPGQAEPPDSEAIVIDLRDR